MNGGMEIRRKKEGKGHRGKEIGIMKKVEGKESGRGKEES